MSSSQALTSLLGSGSSKTRHTRVYHRPKSWTRAIARAVLIAAMWVLVFMALRAAQNMWVVECDDDSRDCYKRRRENTLLVASLAAARMLVIVVGSLTVLAELGVRGMALVTIAGIASLVIGLAAQNALRDLFTGFILLAENQLNIGDIVTVNVANTQGPPLVGKVDSITLRKITVRDWTNTLYFVPNSQIVSVGNASKGFPVVRLALRVSKTLPYAKLDATIDRIVQRLNADTQFTALLADNDDPRVQSSLETLHVPSTNVHVLGVDNSADSTVDVLIRFVTRVGQQWEASRYAQAIALEELQTVTNGVPSAVQVVRLVDGRGSGGGAAAMPSAASADAHSLNAVRESTATTAIKTPPPTVAEVS